MCKKFTLFLPRALVHNYKIHTHTHTRLRLMAGQDNVNSLKTMLLVRPLCSFSLLPAVSPHHSYTFIISSFLIGVIGFVTSKYKVFNFSFLEKQNQKVILQAKKDTQHNLHFSNLNSFTVYLSM